jgi:hypothetical protein
MNPSLLKVSSVLGIIEPVFYFLLITALSLMRSDYRLDKNYISELSGINVKNHKRINLLSFILLGSVVILFSYALRQQTIKHPATTLAHSLLIISGLSIILLGLVPADDKVPTTRGRWHRWLTLPAAIGMPTAMLCYHYIFKKDKRWRKLWPSMSLVLANLTFIIDELLFFKKPKHFIGLVQRLGMGLALLWLFATSAKMYSLQHH